MNESTTTSPAADAAAFDEVVGVVAGWCGAAAPFGLADEALLSRIADAEKLGRLVDGLRVRLAGEVAE
ncbi:hypothetical protein, partial [Subtercola vilae]